MSLSPVLLQPPMSTPPAMSSLLVGTCLHPVTTQGRDSSRWSWASPMPQWCLLNTSVPFPRPIQALQCCGQDRLGPEVKNSLWVLKSLKHARRFDQCSSPGRQVCWAECCLPPTHAPLCNTTHTDERGHTHELTWGGCTCGNGSASQQAANPAVVSRMLLLTYYIPELLGHCMRW